MGGNHTEQDPGADRFADDPAFAVHEGGQLSVVPTRRIESIADLAPTYTPGGAPVSPPTPPPPPGPPPACHPQPPPGGRGAAGSPGRRGSSRSSPTARPC